MFHKKPTFAYAQTNHGRVGTKVGFRLQAGQQKAHYMCISSKQN